MKEVYSCNYKKNKECPKTRCQYIDGIEGCTNTTQWKYAKRTPLNLIKVLKINKRFQKLLDKFQYEILYGTGDKEPVGLMNSINKEAQMDRQDFKIGDRVGRYYGDVIEKGTVINIDGPFYVVHFDNEDYEDLYCDQEKIFKLRVQDLIETLKYIEKCITSDDGVDVYLKGHHKKDIQIILEYLQKNGGK